jgi:hypothetical protein
MIPCVMPVSLVDTSDRPFLAPLLEPFSSLTSYTVTFGPPLFRVSLVTSITWSSSMTTPTTHSGLSRCARSLTPSPPSPTYLPLCPLSLVTPSGTSSAIMNASLITPPPTLSSFLMASSFECRVPTLPRRTVRPSATFVPPTMSCTPCCSRIPFQPDTRLRAFILPPTSSTSYPQRRSPPPHPTSLFSAPLPPTPTFGFSGVPATRTPLPLLLIS